MRIFLVIFIFTLVSCKPSINPVVFKMHNNSVIAHRGAWKAQGLPENSIASLRHAIDLNCAGSEFDVRMTADSVLIVTHDPTYHEMVVEESSYEQLNTFKLENGEDLPTLKSMIEAGMIDNPGTGLVCEIKPSKSKERGQLIAAEVIKLVKSLKAEPFISSYISFDYAILQKIKTLDAKANTQYLNGSKTPEALKADGISGLDYFINVYKKHPDWIQKAKDLGLVLNAWTANKEEDLDWLVVNEFDYITTNEPELLFKRLSVSILKSHWTLVWSDEFGVNGQPDSTKWKYEYGFISNQERQYYTDRLKNVRVEKGNLILEAHRDTIANPKYKSDEFKEKSWLQYIAAIDTARYSSGRLTTKGLAAWKYGRIEVRAKLPKGVGLWPAIWMLGENRTKVGWPECGEIDIMEHVGFNADTVFGTVHTKAFNHTRGTQKGAKTVIEDPYDTYHTYAIEWSKERIDFYLDDKRFYHFSNLNRSTEEWPFNQNFHLILNVAVGGMLGGQKGIDDEVFPQAMLVDYVRVYQKNNQL